MRNSNLNLAFASIGAAGMLLLGIVFVVLIILSDSEVLNEIPYLLPILIGLIAFPAMIFTILYSSRVAHSIGVSSKIHAFGMPPGSVRAILAMGFIVLVLIFGAYTVSEVGSGSKWQLVDRVMVGTEESASEKLRSIFKDYPASYLLIAAPQDAKSGKGGHILVRKEVDNSASVQLAQQVLTMLATALTAIVGFYFGSRTANEPQQAETAERLREQQKYTHNFYERTLSFKRQIEELGGDEEIRRAIVDVSADEVVKGDRLKAFSRWKLTFNDCHSKAFEVSVDLSDMQQAMDELEDGLLALKFLVLKRDATKLDEWNGGRNSLS